jgi:hypothetical protein
MSSSNTVFLLWTLLHKYQPIWTRLMFIVVRKYALGFLNNPSCAICLSQTFLFR